MVTIEVVPYGGWKQALRLANAEVEVIATLEVGPRVLRYAHLGGPNLFKEIPEQLGTSGEAAWRMRGGHRLWTAPEDPAHTYALDNGPTQHGVEGETAWITCPAPDSTGLERTMRLRLEPSGSRVSIDHVIRNRGSQTHRIAPWALTVFAPGGTGIFPLPAYAPHPGDERASAEAFAPQLTLALWSYFRFNDARFSFGDRYVCIKQDPEAKRPAKIGAALTDAWAAYHLQDTLFVKKVPWQAHVTYPDKGCNFETYTDAGILELETLGPLVDLPAGASVSHLETWMLHRGVSLPDPRDEVALDRTLAPLTGSS